MQDVSATKAFVSSIQNCFVCSWLLYASDEAFVAKIFYNQLLIDVMLTITVCLQITFYPARAYTSFPDKLSARALQDYKPGLSSTHTYSHLFQQLTIKRASVCNLGLWICHYYIYIVTNFFCTMSAKYINYHEKTCLGVPFGIFLYI